MNEILYHHTTVVMDCARALLSQEDGPLTDKQRDMTKSIIANAERFILLSMEYEAVPLAEFSPEMRHDLSNPLTPMRGYSDLLSMGVIGSLNERQQNYVERICQSTIELRKLVDSMLAQARQLAAAVAK